MKLVLELVITQGEDEVVRYASSVPIPELDISFLPIVLPPLPSFDINKLKDLFPKIPKIDLPKIPDIEFTIPPIEINLPTIPDIPFPPALLPPIPEFNLGKILDLFPKPPNISVPAIPNLAFNLPTYQIAIPELPTIDFPPALLPPLALPPIPFSIDLDFLKKFKFPALPVLTYNLVIPAISIETKIE
jgi:hypothetical protein